MRTVRVALTLGQFVPFCSGTRLTRRAVPPLPSIKLTRMRGFAYGSLPNGLTSRYIGGVCPGPSGWRAMPKPQRLAQSPSRCSGSQKPSPTCSAWQPRKETPAAWGFPLFGQRGRSERRFMASLSEYSTEEIMFCLFRSRIRVFCHRASARHPVLRCFHP